MKPPSIRFRTFEVVEINGNRQTVISRHTSRFEASRAKKRLEGTVSGRLIVRIAWS